LKHNSGAAVARNHSIKHAKGRFIAFCDSDDLWKPSKLKEQVAFMIREDCAFSYTSYDRINEDGTSCRGSNCKAAITYKDLLKNNYIGCLTAMYDVEKLGKRYMPLLRKRQDWALWLQLLKECDEAKGLQEPLAVYRERSSSISSNKMEMLKYNWLIYHQVEGFGRTRATFQLFLFMIYYIQKKIRD
jgi:glycosyltransferase involved in cell wall biosynthesis